MFSLQATGYAPYFRTFTDAEVGDTYYLSPLPTLCTKWTGLGMAFEDASGTTLALQDNSLNSVPGVPYFGPICVAIQTYDPCGNTPPFPAGNLAVDSIGQTNYILPQATAFVSIKDPAGHPLFIEPGLRHVTVQGPSDVVRRFGEQRSIDLNVAPCTRYYLVAVKPNRLLPDFSVKVDYEEPIGGCSTVASKPS